MRVAPLLRSSETPRKHPGLLVDQAAAKAHIDEQALEQARRSRRRHQPQQCRRRAGRAVELAGLRPISAFGEV